MPQKIRNAPELELGLALYYEAFFDLTTERATGMGLGDIGWLAIDTYCDKIGLSDEQRVDMHHHIRVMDEAYISWINEKNG